MRLGCAPLAKHPACAEALDKYRINPGNVGFREKRDRQFGAIVETAIRHNEPVRIGANWGSHRAPVWDGGSDEDGGGIAARELGSDEQIVL